MLFAGTFTSRFTTEVGSPQEPPRRNLRFDPSTLALETPLIQRPHVFEEFGNPQSFLDQNFSM